MTAERYDMTKPVGFDQKIKLDHLDYTARKARDTERKKMYEILDEYLISDIKGAKSRKNAITMLMKIWFLVDEGHEELRDRALDILMSCSPQERIVLHWGMTMLAYPFFRDLAYEVGNLYQLQNEVSSQQIGRKMKALYGDRRRVEVATSAALSSMKEWGVIQSVKHSIYTLAEKKEVVSQELKLWLAEVVVRVSEYSSMPMDMVISAPNVFPFNFSLNIREMDESSLSVNRQGLDIQMVGIK